MSSDETLLGGDQGTAADHEKPELSLDVNVESPGPCERHVIVTISREDVDRYLSEAFDELVPKAEVPGFRPGRAPRKLVEARFKDQIEERVKGSLLTDALAQLGEEQQFSAIGEPELDLDAVNIPEDGPLTFEFDIEVRPEFEVPQWKGLQLRRTVREHSDEDVQAELDKLLAKRGRMVDREGPVEPNDILDVQVRVTADDKELSTADKVGVRALPVLSFRDANINDFDKLIVGATKGETRSTKVTIGAGAENVEMRGKEVDVAFTVQRIRYVELPRITQDFLGELGDFEDEGDLRDAIRKELDQQLHYRQKQELRRQITDALTQQADWELPPELVKRQAKRELDRLVLELKSSGFSEEDIRSHANQIRQNSLNITDRSLKEHFVFERIAEEEEIDASESDYHQQIEQIARQSDESPRRVRARLEKEGKMDALRNQIIESKVVDLICSEAQLEDVPYEDKEQDTFPVDLALTGRGDMSDIPEAKQGGEARPSRGPAER